jgi:spermidine synthase
VQPASTTRIPIRILAIFVLSGAAGLIDEIVWSRQLVLVFGNTTQAVSAILTGFFGGMAIGAFIGGRVADRVRSPLRLYALVELVLVFVVLATPVTFRLIDDAYRAIYPGLEAAPQLLALIRMLLSVVALAPATVLMGATLPSLTRHLTRGGHLSAAFGKLYAANTIGAIGGTLATGFVLIEILGLTGALVVGAACSGVAGLAAFGLSRGPAGGSVADPSADTPATAEASAGHDPIDRGVPGSRQDVVGLGLAVAFVSGLTSLGYQVLWTRLLASGTGNTTYVFTVILALFLVGLALGALLFDIIRPRVRDPIRLLAGAQILIAAVVLLGLIGVIQRPSIVDPNDFYELTAQLFGAAVPVVLLATIILGLTFPAASALLAADARRTGRNAGTFLAVNTVGAIVGSFVVPFALIPTLGSPHALVLLAMINVVTGAALAVRAAPVGVTDRNRVSRLAMPLGAALVGVALVGVAVVPGALIQPNEARIRDLGGTLFAAAEDEIAAVEAGQRYATPELWVAGTSMTLLTVDAKLMPILPLIARPESEDALVVAFGMGTAYRTALIAGLRTEAVELVPSVLQMFQFYYPDAAAVLANPNGRVIIADGRNHLELTDRHYDIIVTDPPPPIESSGASVISSREYYQVGRDHLKPNGVMMQWIPWDGTVEEYRAHIRTFASVFPNVTIVFGSASYGSYVLGSEAPIELPPDAIRQVLARPGVLEDISSAFDSPASTVDGWVARIDALTWISGPDVVAFAGVGPMVTDDRPFNEYFYLRRRTVDGTPTAGPGTLRNLVPGG